VDTPYSTYAWIIDKDLITDGRHKAPSLSNSVGLTGPNNADPTVINRLLAGQGRQFRLLDGDGKLYYEGRVLSADIDFKDDSYMFSPLDDFGKGNAGCTEIQYHYPARWETL